MSTRRSFLGLAGLGTLAAATGTPLFGQKPTPTPRREPVTETWDMSWTGKVTGKHRAVFDSPKINGGAGVMRAMLWRDEVKEVYGGDLADATAVLVLRHEAIPLVMDDEFWARYEVGKEVKMKDPATRRWYTKNPVRTSPPDASGDWARYNLDTFVKEGGIVLGCGLAFKGMVGGVAHKDKISPEDADKLARQHLLPGVTLQPSGIFAVLSAQETGCNFFAAS
jgi:hypothetical protein